MTEEQKIATEVAEAEFDRFVEAMDLDVDTSKMGEDDAASFETQKRRIVAALCDGSLVINEDGEPVFTPRTVEVPKGSITFYEPTGASLMASDGKKKDDRVKAMYAVMGAMTRQHPSVFANMKRRELRVCEAVALLFLG